MWSPDNHPILLTSFVIFNKIYCTFDKQSVEDAIDHEECDLVNFIETAAA